MIGNHTERMEALTRRLYELLRPALWRWGRYTSTNYTLFQPIVALHLTSVDHTAACLLKTEMHQRQVNDHDRQRAVWYLIRDAIKCLRPPVSVVPTEIQTVLDVLPHHNQPRAGIIPSECYQYLVLHLAYVTRSHSNDELAALFRVSLRTVANIRNAAIGTVARHIVAWEINYSPDGDDQRR